MAEIFHQKSNKTRSSGTDKVSNSGLGPDLDQSANSFLPHDAGRFMIAVTAMQWPAGYLHVYQRTMA